MNFVGRFQCWLNGHLRSVSGPGYLVLEQTYVLSEDLHLKYCPRCHKVTWLARDRDQEAVGWNPTTGALRYNPLLDECEVWVKLGE